MIDRVAYAVPLLHTQLGYPVSGKTDCAVRTCQSAIEFATWGQESPPPKDLRPLMGANLKGGTGIGQALKAVRSFDVDPLKIAPNNKGPIAKVEEWLKAGLFVSVYGNNGAVIDGWRDLAGSKTFRGGHCSGAFGWDNGEVLWFDPLYDGRRPNIPKGPTMVPFEMVKAFTGAMAGNGRAMAYAVPLDGRLAAARTDLDSANTELAQVQAALLDVTEQLTETQYTLATTQAALAECQAKPPADCAECEAALVKANETIANVHALTAAEVTE